ncbi:ubiquitin carboxyl-terminal hydrolase 12-like isoform X7 [Sebastes umbrosus]|uniref:ubiquitin carboxyl-terminal hydrolase 12-like isoform X7 n=1 Tax=Sebastes umbrosus TaxID=72105 RepID=UPI00189F8F1B|nr:ubiquitin carboxyl-terminal hydrolase 12-like isoform X7 [Sebastes umbrosus]
MDFIENGLRYLYNMLFSPAASKYYGLLNQGATCYLNSVLQVLFMTEDFREAVKRHTCETCGPKCIDRHLASLFDDLKGCTAYTYKITNHLGIDNVYEQRDAAEYFEKILGLTSPEASQIFHGESTHKTKCSACCEETEAGGAFWYLPLALVDSNSEDYSVVSGIKEYFRTSDFSGENQMYCDKCDAKTDATIKCVIKRHPEVLMLLLKRFEFDYSYMRYVKNNHTVDVPCTLQIPENQTYELYAVVDHFGGLRGGHYNATIKPVTIKPQEERWYKFNDDSVTVLEYQPFQVDNIKKSGSAYLLFYRKKTVHAAGACTQDREVSTPEKNLQATDDVPGGSFEPGKGDGGMGDKGGKNRSKEQLLSF